MSEQQRVIVLKPCCIGDAVMALPVIQNLRESLPDARIAVWTGWHSRPIFEHHPAVDEVQPIRDVPGFTALPGIVLRLRASQADTLIVLDRSRLLEHAASHSGVPTIATVPRGDTDGKHETDCYLDVLGSIGIAATSSNPRLGFSPEQLHTARETAAACGRRFVVLHPGGAENPGTRMHSKRWPVEHWVTLVDWLQERRLGIALTGSPSERSLCLEIAARSLAGFERVSVLAGDMDVMQSAAVASCALAFVGPDTGMSHLAAAAGVPTIAIFGPTNPARYAPRGKRVAIFAPDCSWNITDVDLRQGSAVGDLPSTKEITPDLVIRELEQMLSQMPGVAE